MCDCKLVSILFFIGTKLSLYMCPDSNDDTEEMFNGPYASVIGNLMYAQWFVLDHI